ncbi:dTDP-4-dehydrorhamnose reductase [Marinobacter sp. C2H3]|uniref:dTDP-4-dehydrorhamnose reductase n=1 Tax=Marinobacter sp. C2H3 TaxID=3119003 RepID=UPI00300F6A86
MGCSKSLPIILLLGKDGQVGRELSQSLMPYGQIVALGRGELDLTDLAAIERVLTQFQPDIVVNAAAYTAVDAAEGERALASRVNAEVPGLLSEWAARAGALLIHYSTDYVFDGRARRPYRENDATSPLNVYGETKLEGEKLIRQSGARHLIFRTCWVYGLHGHNFLKTMLRLMQDKQELRVVADQFGVPTSSRLIADVTTVAVSDYLRARGSGRFDSGVYHLSSRGEASWYGFASHIATSLPACFPHLSTALERVTPVSTEEFPTIATRPAYSVLDVSALEKRFSLKMPDWEQGVELCLKQLATVADANFRLA